MAAHLDGGTTSPRRYARTLTGESRAATAHPKATWKRVLERETGETSRVRGPAFATTGLGPHTTQSGVALKHADGCAETAA